MCEHAYFDFCSVQKTSKGVGVEGVLRNPIVCDTRYAQIYPRYIQNTRAHPAQQQAAQDTNTCTLGGSSAQQLPKRIFEQVFEKQSIREKM